MDESSHRKVHIWQVQSTNRKQMKTEHAFATAQWGVVSTVRESRYLGTIVGREDENRVVPHAAILQVQ